MRLEVETGGVRSRSAISGKMFISSGCIIPGIRPEVPRHFLSHVSSTSHSSRDNKLQSFISTFFCGTFYNACIH